MKRYFIELSYKGTDFCGWQIQPKDKTIQGEINIALTKLNRNNKVLSMGCGRTDTGVHALQFFVHIDFPIIIDLDKFKYKLNNMLPYSIVIHNMFEVDAEAHARYDAVSRTYKYKIVTNKNAFNHDTTLLFKQNLNINAMNKACDILLTHSDFECFSKVKTEVNNFNCEITQANWINTNNGLEFTITANRFLRNMVRSIVGTMILVGQELMSIQDFVRVIESKKRNNAGKSVSANGLFLVEVKYEYIN